MDFSKVITHNTAFHADDVMAVAMLRYADFEFELIRTRTPSVFLCFHTLKRAIFAISKNKSIKYLLFAK